MKIQRFYIENKIEDKSTIRVVSRELVNQLRNVFRLKSNDMVILFDNSGFDYVSCIKDYEDDIVIFSIVEKKINTNFLSKNIYLISSIIKKDKYEWIIEKATELGVSHLIPVLSRYTEKKNINHDRLKKIIIEASEQSGRVYIPELHNTMSLEESVRFIKNKKEILPIVFHTEGMLIKDSKIQNMLIKASSIAVFIGPEGGWSEEEIDMFHRESITISCLGPQILRAETAVIASISSIIF